VIDPLAGADYVGFFFVTAAISSQWKIDMSDQPQNITYAVNEKLLVLDPSLRVIDASSAYYKGFKVLPAETVGWHLWELGNGQWNLAPLLTQLRELTEADGGLCGFEVHHDFPNLGPKAMLLSARRLLNKKNGTERILLAIDEIADPGNKLTELSEQRARFESTLHSVNDAVIVTDADARITFMNPTAERLTGWTKREALSRLLGEVFNIVDDRMHRPVECPVPRAIREGPIVELAGLTILISRGGVQWPIDDKAMPIRDDAGKIIGVAIIFHTTSNRRRTQKRLEISEVRYRRLFESAHDGILILDALTGRVLDVNRFLLDLLQFPAEHFLGKELWEIGVLHDIEANKAAMATLKQRGSIRYEDMPLQDKYGKCIPVEFVSNVYREGDRDVIQCNVRDITERRSVQKELQNAKASAEDANRAKSEFLANMSHEIRTPMTAIMGFADMIVQPKQTEEGRIECVQVIRRNGAYLLELINGILDLSKIEAGKMTVESVPCDVPQLLADMVAIVRPRAAEKGLEFELKIKCPIPRVVWTDPTRLRQILVNLLGNSIKFTVAGKITMEMCAAGTEPNHQLCFEVKDSGIGMTPEQIERLFKPFAQADESITRKFGGTGLGLTISRQLARMLGGDIEVKSEFGVGTTFNVCVDGGSFAGVEMLNGVNEKMLPLTPSGEGWEDIPLHGRILLVEDGRDNQRLLSTHLVACGAEVAVAENGQFAIDMIAKDAFDLILMDMQMPVMDGYTATKELRRKGCTTPIIALTAYAMAEDRKKCMECGCNDYLSKPIDRQVLLTTASRYMNKTEDTTSATVVPTKTPGSPEAASGPIKSILAQKPGMMAIITEFVDGLPGEVQKMNTSLAQNDMSSLRQIVHQLRGSGGGYGFTRITETANTAQQSIDSSANIESTAAQVKALIDVIRRVEGYDEKKAKNTSRATVR
jgi:PAS domain S-box-containing protein